MMLDTLQMILGVDSSSTPLINYYIQKASQYFLDETNLEVVPTTANDILIDLVILYWNKKGSEGVNSESNSGISYTWSLDLPLPLKRQISSYRVLKW